MFINLKNGYAVQLLAQDEKSVVHYSQDGGDELTMPSRQFFTEFREATADEIAPKKVVEKK